MNASTEKNIAKVKERLVQQWKLIKARFRGCIVGVVLGYMTSFLFQNAMIRAKLGFGGYIAHVLDVLTCFKNNMSEVAIIAWLGILVGGWLGAYIEEKLVIAGLVQPYKRKSAGSKPLDQTGNTPASSEAN